MIKITNGQISEAKAIRHDVAVDIAAVVGAGVGQYVNGEINDYLRRNALQPGDVKLNVITFPDAPNRIGLEIHAEENGIKLVGVPVRRFVIELKTESF